MTTSARPPAPPAARCSDLIDWVLARAGLDARHYRPGSLERRTAACLRALRVRTEEQARLALEERPERLATAINALLIGVTEFFRDPPVFQFLMREGLPALAARSSGLRVWSAACAHGAELYSVALLLAEAGLLEDSLLWGTDCRAGALAEAAQGLYGEQSLRFVDPVRRARFFRGEGCKWRLIPALRRCVGWSVRDLLAGPEPGPWDLVLCRNVAIYLAPPAAEALWRQLAGVLRPGGLLVVGKAERPHVAGLNCLQRCIYRKAASQ